MSWLGKILGGGLGMALGGPLGAVIGAGLGHALVDARPGPGRPGLTARETRQMAFFATTFAMLGKMAKADGRVSPEEIEVVDRFIQDRLGLDPRARKFAISIFNEGKDSSTPFLAFARQFGQVFADDPQLRHVLFEVLFRLAMADGTLHAKEDELLRQALGPLGLPTDVYDDLRGRAGPDLASMYALLGCDASATDEEVKKRYRQMAREYHPDKIVSKGLPEEFTRFAEEKFKEINTAYEKIMAHRQSSSA